jgi:hypothetical protein
MNEMPSVERNEIGAEDGIDRPVDEVGVFEEAEEGDIEQEAGAAPHATGPANLPSGSAAGDMTPRGN